LRAWINACAGFPLFLFLLDADMDATDDDDIIATRTLDVDGKPRFHMRIYRPQPEDGGNYWRCRYVVDGPLTRHASSQCGIDAMQALLLTIYILATEADVSEENVMKRLSWGGQSQHFGIPSGAADPGMAELLKLSQEPST
jgi:hypothetical protein